MSGLVRSLNVGRAEESAYALGRAGTTGFRKRPVSHCEVRDPGPRGSAPDGHCSGLIGDFIGDRRHHGGTQQAVYAYAREDLDWWAARLGRELQDGAFGENLTTTGIEVNQALIGEIWLLGPVQLRVTCGRIPCRTFAGELGQRRWVKEFTAARRPGPYLAVVHPGTLSTGASIEVAHRPAHGVSVELWFRANTTEPELLPQLAAAGSDLPTETLSLHSRRGLVAR